MYSMFSVQTRILAKSTQFELELTCSLIDYLEITKVKIQGLHPLSNTSFQGISRTQIDFSRVLKFSLDPTLPRSQC